MSQEFDWSQLEAKFEKWKEFPDALGKALYSEGERIMGDSKDNYCPVDLGTLKSSGYVQQPVTTAQGVEVVLGYGGAASAYALVVHENPRAGKTGGRSPQGKKYKHWAKVGQWKYLEKPMLAAEEGFEQRVGKDVEAAIK